MDKLVDYKIIRPGAGPELSQGRAGQGRGGQGRAGQGRAGQAGQGRAGQGRAGLGWAGQGRAGQGKGPHDEVLAALFPHPCTAESLQRVAHITALPRALRDSLLRATPQDRAVEAVCFQVETPTGD